MSTARRTALLSFLAALALVATKLLVGLATSSLGILAEALHSGLDAVAALVSLYAVGVAERPPDEQHQYGHGKAQHLAALSEAAILAAVAIWIGFEAVMRLRSGGGDVQPEWYAFVLLFGVLIVDAARWSVSFRTGTRERNAALLASAWHFASDFAGTTAVLIGLALVSAGYPRADAVAALTVAALVLIAATRLAVRNIDALMDRAPSGLDQRIGQIAQDVPGVAEVRSVRVREAGGESFADVVIGVSRLEGLERSHQTMDQVEDAVRSQIGPAQVTVHVEPSTGAEAPNERVAAAALRVPGVVETHNISVLEQGSGGRAITLHVRLPEDMPMREAALTVEQLKREIRSEFGVARVYAHVEPSALGAQPARDIGAEQPQLVRAASEAVTRVAGQGAAEVVVYRQGERLLVVTSLRAEPGRSVREAHVLASRVEDAVRDALDSVDDVIVEVSADA
ncbi:MAG TPA: cation diffusion facilitator family transporter [Gaiellales bacterium]|jgi:cation diffusion facilitator family transporter|nr:cation diffusion facilitator family transporter [Gaiellales bacterium]